MTASLLTALHMSYTVNAATLAAVKASISTPVWPLVLTSDSTRTQQRSGSSCNCTSALDIMTLWHSGIKLLVALAPMMPASCAVERTSPFLIWFFLTRSSACEPMWTVAQALARRSVTAFCMTIEPWHEGDVCDVIDPSCKGCWQPGCRVQDIMLDGL